MVAKTIEKLTIGKLAERTGINTDTLRYYEKMGLIKAASRSESGYRIYGEDAERILTFIKGAKTLNFTLEEIRQLLRGGLRESAGNYVKDFGVPACR